MKQISLWLVLAAFAVQPALKAATTARANGGIDCPMLLRWLSLETTDPTLPVEAIGRLQTPSGAAHRRWDTLRFIALNPGCDTKQIGTRLFDTGRGTRDHVDSTNPTVLLNSFVRANWVTRERTGSEPFTYKINDAGRAELSRVANAVAYVFQRTLHIERPQVLLSENDFRTPVNMPPLTGVDYVLLSRLPGNWTTPEALESSARAFGLDWGAAGSTGQFPGLYRSLGRWLEAGYVERQNNEYRLTLAGNRERIRFLLFFWNEGF